MLITTHNKLNGLFPIAIYPNVSCFRVTGSTEHCYQQRKLFRTRTTTNRYSTSLSAPLNQQCGSSTVVALCYAGSLRRLELVATNHIIAVNMDRKKCETFSSFRWRSPDICHINILRNPNEVDVHWSRSAKPK